MTALRYWLIGQFAATALVLGINPAMATPLSLQEQLGKELFFDKTLSHNGNQSCSSCHSPSASFTDPDKSNPTSKGDNPDLFGKRNAPSAGYAAFSPEFHFDTDEGLWIGGQFLDGRAATLEEQAKAPFVGALEMGLGSHAEVIDRLKNGPVASLFLDVYGVSAFDDVEDAYNKLAKAIATYERTSELSPFTSKFDAFLKGEVQLSPHEQRGMEVFNDPAKGNCAACHISTPGPDDAPPLFTDFTYDNIGIPKNYASGFLYLPTEFNPDGVDFLDGGLGVTVGDDSLLGAFKVPSLRNVALTAPYTHNGYFNSLLDVVDFYATRDTKPVCDDDKISEESAELIGCWAKAEFGDTMNVEELGNLPLTGEDMSDIVAFLNTLTDGFDKRGIPPSTDVPEPSTWAMIILGFGFLGAAVRGRVKRGK